MIKKFRIWLAGKLIDLAIYVEFETVLYFTMDVTRIISGMIAEKGAEKATEVAKPKRGRPKGSKTINVREGVKLGRPKGRKDSVGKLLKSNDNA